MLLAQQHAHSLPGQVRPGGESSEARADDHGVVFVAAVLTFSDHVSPLFRQGKNILLLAGIWKKTMTERRSGVISPKSEKRDPVIGNR